MLSARVRALPFVREPTLEGDEESGGRLALGGGGKVVGVLVGLGESNVGESRPALGVSSIWCEGLRSHSGFRRDVISTALV